MLHTKTVVLIYIHVHSKTNTYRIRWNIGEEFTLVNWRALANIKSAKFIDDDVIVTHPCALWRCCVRKNPQDKLVVSSVVPSLSLQRVNEGVKHSMEQEASKKKCMKYNKYSGKERAQIGKYAAENGAACAVWHLSKVLDWNVPETTAGFSWILNTRAVKITKVKSANYSFAQFSSNSPNIIPANIPSYTVYQSADGNIHNYMYDSWGRC